MKREARDWQDALAWLAYAECHNYTVPQPVQIAVSGRFKDERSTPDLANLHKLIGDALQMALGINDKHFCFHDRGYTISKDEPPMIYVCVEVE